MEFYVFIFEAITHFSDLPHNAVRNHFSAYFTLFLLMQNLSQPLAGRCGILHVLPFSRAELEGQSQPEPADPAGLFSKLQTGLECWKTLRCGFYPRIHDRGIPPEIWLSDYVRTYVERDLRALVNVGDLETFERFLGLFAGRTPLSFSGGISQERRSTY